MSFLFEDEELMMDMIAFGKNDIEEYDIDFSFKFYRMNYHDNIRVDLSFDSNDLLHFDGYMYLCNDYGYVEYKDSIHQFSFEKLNSARNFFKKYKVFFSALWEGYVCDCYPTEYFLGITSFDEVVKQGFRIKRKKIKSIEELEKYVRDHNLFNMND